MRWTILLKFGKFGMWGAEDGGHLHYDNLVRQGSTELRMCENHVLVLPVNKAR